MLTASVKTTKKRLLSVLCVILAFVVAILLFFFGGKELPTEEALSRSVKNNGERLSFLSSYGFSVEEEPETVTEIFLPDEMDAVLEGYNALQKPLGLDLTPYLGKTVKRYSYRVNGQDEGEETFVTLYVYNDLIIAADVSSHTEHWQRAIDNPGNLSYYEERNEK